MNNELGTGPIDPALHNTMNKIAEVLDETFNPVEGEKEVGFILMTFNLGDQPGRCNYISNANRNDVMILLREQLAYFMGMPQLEEKKV